MASDSVIAFEESGGAVWTASVGVTNAPKARARMMHTRLFMRSLVAEADDWILSRGAVSGHDPERDAHGERHAEGDEHGQGRHDRGDSREPFDADRQADADENTGYAAGHADQHRLAQELKEDVLLGGAHGATHPDLPDPLQDRREHDVHDPDAAHHERNGGDRPEHDVEDRLGALLLAEEQLRHGDFEVHDRVVPAGEHALQDVGDRRDVARFGDAHDDPVELVAVGALLTLLLGLRRRVVGGGGELPGRLLDIALRELCTVPEPDEHGAHRHVHVHVGVADAQALRGLLRQSTILEHPDDGDPGLTDLEGPADGILGREEAGAYAMADYRDGDRPLHVMRCERRPACKRQARPAEGSGVYVYQLS